MEAGSATPLLDFFRRGDVEREIRLMAAQGSLELRPGEQRGILELLAGDADEEVAELARASLIVLNGRPLDDAAPPAEPARTEEAAGDEAEGGKKHTTALERIAAMSPGQRLALAMRGSREERAILIRDPNKIVSVAVLSSPKITDAEVENIAKMANVSEDVLRIIGHARAWVKNYAIVSALTKNPKTPVAIALNLLPRLLEKDVKGLTTDRNVSDVLRLAAKKRLTPSK